MNKLITSVTLIVFLTLLFSISGFSQDPLSNQEITNQLISKGITEAELQDFLDKKGLTTTDLQTLSPEELIELDTQLNEFIANSVKVTSQTDNSTTASTPVNDAESPEVIINSPSTNSEEVPQDTKPEKVRRYGDQFFKNNNLSFVKSGEEGPVPGNYVLNSGDQVSVSIYGRSQLDNVYSINNQGAILYDNNNRRLILEGLTLNQAREKIERAFRQYYVFGPGEINVNVAAVSSINVNIYGEVTNPGGYVISAVNSPINAILAANGILPSGTYRNIKLIKNDGGTNNIDIYQLLNSPDTYKSLSLSNNDIIHVPIIGKEVELQGEVRRPLMYELLENESLNDLLEFAGGTTVNADKSRLQIIRIENSVRRVIDIDMNSSAMRSFQLLSGDIVKILSVNSEVSNSISVSGQLNNEGEFELTEGLKVSGLLEQLVLNDQSRTDLALIQRTYADGSTELIKVNLDAIIENPQSAQNVLLQSNDKLLIWSKSRFIDNAASIKISGAIKSPGTYKIDIVNSSNLEDAILFAGGLRRDASDVGMIYRKDPLNDKKIKYIKIQPKSAQESDRFNIELMPFDSIVVLGKNAISTQYKVEIYGEVNQPGKYQFGEEMTVKDLIVLANGFKLSAQTNQIEISRTIIEANKSTEVKVATLNADPNLLTDDEASNYILQPFDKVFVRSVPEFELQKTVEIKGEVRYPGRYVLIKENESLNEIIKRAGGVTNEAFLEGASLYRAADSVGYVIMNMDAALSNSRSKFNYLLHSRDVITVPKNEDVVTLRSPSLDKRIPTNDNDFKVIDQISIAYFPGKSAKYYIQEFGGGFSKRSDKSGVFVQHPNGEIARTKDFGLFKTYPKVRKGSTIVIPNKPLEKEKDSDNEEKVDWSKLLSDSVAQAMSILTLLLLAERV